MSRLLSLFLPVALVASACSTAPKSDEDKDALGANVEATVAAFKKNDDSMMKFFDEAAGRAVIPTVGKASASAEPTARAWSSRAAASSATAT